MLCRTLYHNRLEMQAYDPPQPTDALLPRPEPVALNFKVVVIADLDDYSHLHRYDHKCREIFGIGADFDNPPANEPKS